MTAWNRVVVMMLPRARSPASWSQIGKFLLGLVQRNCCSRLKMRFWSSQRRRAGPVAEPAPGSGSMMTMFRAPPLPVARTRRIPPRRAGISDEGTAEAMGRQLTVEKAVSLAKAKATVEAETYGQCTGWTLGYCFRDRGSGDRW